MNGQTYEQTSNPVFPGQDHTPARLEHTLPPDMNQYQQTNATATPTAPVSQQPIDLAPPPGPPPGYDDHQQPLQHPSQPPASTTPNEQDPYISSDHDQHQHKIPELEAAPPKPPRPVHTDTYDHTDNTPSRSDTPNFAHTQDTASNYVPMGLSSPLPNYNYVPPPPPRRIAHATFDDEDDPSSPVHYARDPHKLVGYLIPFPQPILKDVDTTNLPTRFLIYTPPPPPLAKPKEGDKEGKLHKVQRKWQEEVRTAKSSTAQVASWEGVKSRATKAIAWGVNKTTTSNLEFLGRVSDGNKSDSDRSDGGKDGASTAASATTKKTVHVDEMLLAYPPSMGLDAQQMRTEFVNSMLRTKSKAQRDSIIATGLLPVGYGIDILATLIWPFGGLGEIDTVWLYSSVRGAKTARSVTKRLHSSAGDGDGGDPANDTLHLNFIASRRLDVLEHYLHAECHRLDPARFPAYRSSPTESQVLEAIGWEPSQCGGETRNWEDEHWEMTEVKDDLKSNMHKGAKEWRKFVLAYAKNPEKALKSNK